MYLSRPIFRTRSMSPGAGPNPRRFKTCTMVLSSGFFGTADEAAAMTAVGGALDPISTRPREPARTIRERRVSIGRITTHLPAGLLTGSLTGLDKSRAGTVKLEKDVTTTFSDAKID